MRVVMNICAWTNTPIAALGRVVLATTLAAAISLPAVAGPRDQAKRIHDRLAGVPPSAAVLDQMEADILAGNPAAAAETAMEDVNF